MPKMALMDGRSGQMAQNPEKSHFSLPHISHNVHYTKFMLLKNKVSSLASARFGDSIFMSGRMNCTNKILLLLPLLVSQRQKFSAADWSAPSRSLKILSFRFPAAAVFRNNGRLLHSRPAPLFCSPLHFRTEPHQIHWSQSTVPPERPDSLHLPAA